MSFGTGYLRKAEDTRVAAELEGLAGIALDWTVTYLLKGPLEVRLKQNIPPASS